MIMASGATSLNEHYRFWLNTRYPDCGLFKRGEEVPQDATCAILSRDKNSHRGIEQRTGLRELEAHAVNQEFLEGISRLNRPEYVALDYPITATDLFPLTTLVKLRILKINSPRNLVDFTPLLALLQISTRMTHSHFRKWLAVLIIDSPFRRDQRL